MGKLSTIPVPEEFFGDLTGKSELTLATDEAKGCGDGWALDFVRLLVNRKRENTCQGTNRGKVVDAEGEAPKSKPELDKVVKCLKDNPMEETEPSGPPQVGDAAANCSLSYRQVKPCKDDITGTGVDPGRIVAVGHGPDFPVAPNDTEKNRQTNRRVELRVVKD